MGLFQFIASTAWWIYNSQGKTDLHFKWGIVGGILTFIAFGIGINWGVMGGRGGLSNQGVRDFLFSFGDSSQTDNPDL